MKVSLLPILLLPLVPASTAITRGPNPFFGYDPTPAPSGGKENESFSSYSSISSFARGYQPPKSTTTTTSTEPTASKEERPMRKALSTSSTASTSASKHRTLSSAAQKHFNLPGLSTVSTSTGSAYQAPVRSYQPAALFYKASEEEDSYEVPAKYDFDWSVKDEPSGNDYKHQESRKDDYTRGSYSVLLPDGRIQTVTYYVDGDSGYMAEVSYRKAKSYPPKAHLYH